ncbi:MAG: porin family protein [bacterium]|nr:porin family protein [bacterium]
MSSKIPVIFLALLLAASAASAQKVEITPFVGFQFVGRFGEDFDHGTAFGNLEVEEGESFGLMLDFAINRHAQIDVLYSFQESELEVPFYFGPHNRLDVDVDVEYFQVGFLWQWLPSDEVRPFVVGSIGATSFDFEGGASDTHFSTTVGGGVKLMFNDTVGVRFEGRAYHTFVDADRLVFCNPDNCVTYRDTSLFLQFDLKAGLVFAF